MEDLQACAPAPRYRLWWGAALVVAFLAASAWMLDDMRRAAWASAERSSTDLLGAVSRSIEREFETLDLSVRALARGMAAPELREASPALRHAALFDASASASGLGLLVAVGPDGRVVDASGPSQAGTDVSDRPYFLDHRDSTDPGLRVSAPFRSRVTGRQVVTLSRRVTDAGGSFLGVAVGTIRVDHLADLLGSVNPGPGGAVNLFLADGTLVARRPEPGPGAPAGIAGSERHARYLAAREGSFTAPAVPDAEDRLYVFRRIGGTGLVLDVAVSTRALMEEWHAKATLLSVILVGLCLGMGLFVAGAGRELADRRAAERSARAAEAEAARLAETDPLTGLANRRRFDRVMDQEGRRTDRGAAPLSLVVLDVDRFKDLNDARGHGEGDRVLRRLSERIGAHVRHPGEVACRIGGEEFAVILPCVDLAEAQTWAERVRGEIEGLALPGARGPVTVSAGVAQALPGEIPATTLARADAALYEAKRAGRNRVRAAA